MGKKKDLFDLIAPIYARFFNFQVRYYTKVLSRVKDTIDMSNYKTVLDIGCGPGALCYVMYKKGLHVTGIDSSQEMVTRAKARLKSTNIHIFKIKADEQLPFPKDSFDLVISSYVAHGLTPDQRNTLYIEASRLAKEKVIFHDYNENRALITTIVEWLEKGDYFNFIKVAKKEMLDNFEELTVIDVDKRAAWYIAKPRKKI